MINFLEKTLLSSQSAADARKYLTEKRGLTLDVCQQYGLGLCIQEFPEDVEKDGKKEKLKEAAQLLESYRDDDRKAKVEATKKVTAEKKKKKEIEEAKEKEKAIKAAAKSAKMEQKSKEKMAKKAAREKKKLLAEKENVVSAEGEVKKRGRPNKASLAPKSETISVGFRGTVGSYGKVGIKDENDVQGFINSEPPLEAVDEAVGAEEPTTEEKEAPKETFVAKKEDNSGSLGVTKRVEIEEKRNAYKRVPGPRWVKEVCLTFPWITPIKTLSGDELKAFTKLAVVKKKPAAVQAIVRIKVRALSGKGKQRLLPKGGGWGFFGWHLVNEEDTSIIITEGEFDAMAVFQTLRKLPASHPFGRYSKYSISTT